MERTNPILRAGFLSKLFFWWVFPLLKKGNNQTLERKDIYNITEDQQSAKLGERLEREWEEQLQNSRNGTRKPSLCKALFRIFGFEYMLLDFILLFEEAIKVMQPVLLSWLVRYFMPGSQVTKTESFLLAGGFSICAMMLVILHHHFFFGAERIGMKMRIACSSLLYRKALRLRNTGYTGGLLANDVGKFDSGMLFLHYNWIGSVEIVVVSAILFREFGYYALAGIGLFLVWIPVLHWAETRKTKNRRERANQTNRRVDLMEEIINGMKVIKMYCWERPFGDRIRNFRRSETQALRKEYCLIAVLNVAEVNSRHVFMLAIMLCISFTSQHFEVHSLFMAIAYFEKLSLGILRFMRLGYNSAKELQVSIQKMENVLLEENFPESGQSGENQVPQEQCYVEIRNVSAQWNQRSSSNNEKKDDFKSKKISAKVDAGKKLAIIGPAGAGKTSLLMTVLKELPVQSVSVKVRGRVAYVSQEPVMFSQSIRDNITFGSEFDNMKYQRTLKACGLNEDIKALDIDDQQLVGQGGVILSRGQQARVCLARALYQDADVYLLDDPLGAVDAKLGKHIFENVIQDILKDKPIVWVMHQFQFLDKVDQIIYLEKGEVRHQGTLDELQKKKKLVAFLQKQKENEEGSVHPDSVAKSIDEHRRNVPSASNVTVQIQEEELTQAGTSMTNVYHQYFKAGAGIPKLFLLIILGFVSHGSFIFSDWWLYHWSNQEEIRYASMTTDDGIRNEYRVNATNTFITEVDTHFNLKMFTGLIVCAFLFGFFRNILVSNIALSASEHFHSTMFACVMRYPMRFFDTRPSGDVKRRFSKHVGQMDNLLHQAYADVIQCTLLIIGVLSVTVATNQHVFIGVSLLVMPFAFVRDSYIRTSRQLKKFEEMSSSRVSSHIAETLPHLHTIRALGKTEKFREEFDCHQDCSTEVKLSVMSASRWLSICLDCICAIFVTMVSFGCVLNERLNAGLVGLSLTYAMTLMAMLQWCVKRGIAADNGMESVKQVIDYTMLQPETALQSDWDSRPPEDWPQKGKISFDGVRLRYSEEGPFVLKDLSFTIKAGERVGIVGRTGVGKSSLINVLFRLDEPDGKITIDGIDIKHIGLRDLRKCISAFPQETVVFKGDMRTNIDPLDEHTEDKISSALDDVQYQGGRFFARNPDIHGDDSMINLSVGERQKICLARAILRCNKILVIDEATTYIDEGVHSRIREKFKNCTILIIAHRLETIVDCNRVMVLDQGQIVEFDAPNLLLEKPDGMLSKLVEETGPTTSQYLRERARATFESNM